jgi:alkanesulfonate monooxygenase SsuD/methylene tetrahydromethanopterin reductase-like flavin-dependent oxidoreductase (luciferase family)
MLDEVLACAAVGSPETVSDRLQELVARTGADELILTSQVHDHRARLRCFEIAAGVRDRLT